MRVRHGHVVKMKGLGRQSEWEPGELWDLEMESQYRGCGEQRSCYCLWLSGLWGKARRGLLRMLHASWRLHQPWSNLRQECYSFKAISNNPRKQNAETYDNSNSKSPDWSNLFKAAKAISFVLASMQTSAATVRLRNILLYSDLAPQFERKGLQNLTHLGSSLRSSRTFSTIASIRPSVDTWAPGFSNIFRKTKSRYYMHD